ncbi:endonuclease/exonuclease/phosphatase family protein [Mycobacterium sp. TJFP1]|uniref:Endonuclease/exonuclease/phosphatase n=1 Tax=Mycolicibacterium vanbaalenii (strain DSM 7251 / JCM 13017 / BCRC 16820 / KCTC 9966 / NRRL B-24157 / PYR-1) TaxID=350058 RepID=A1T8I1_MYCVP|nr:Endonuclease/exonuclease/phosphatase [Mycolicibacterium vanbaalenii PYR-1]
MKIDRSVEGSLTRRYRSRSRARTLAGAVGLVALLVSGAGVGAHFFGPVSTVVTLLASFSPLCIVLAAVAVLVLVSARLWYAALAALLVVGAGVVAQSPLYVGEAAPDHNAASARLRLLQTNIKLGEADVPALAGRVRSEGVDVLTVAELTPPAADRLAAAGIGQTLPYSYLMPKGGGGGGGIYSRYPLTDEARLPDLQHNNLRATINVAGAKPVAVYALHPEPPYPLPSWRWALELDRISATLAAEPLPLIVGADFNSTFDHERYRSLLHAGAREGASLVDAAEFLGSGIVATYPADSWVPAVLAIDRILTRGVTPSTFRRVEIPGSDHHGVIGDVLLPAPGQR